MEMWLAVRGEQEATYNQTVVAGIGDDLALHLHVDASGGDVPAVAAPALGRAS